MVAEQLARQIRSKIGVQEQQERQGGQYHAHCAAAPFQHQPDRDAHAIFAPLAKQLAEKGGVLGVWPLWSAKPSG